MNTTTIGTKVQFHGMILLPFLLAAFLIAAFFGCQQKQAETKGPVKTVTADNLQTAYAKEVNYAHMYHLFAARATKDRLQNIAMLYNALAISEEIHAKDHEGLMKTLNVMAKPVSIDSLSIGSTIQTMKMAISSEDIEVSSMYPNLAHTAEAEQLKEIATRLTHVRDADARQKELLEAASGDLAHYPKATYWVCPGCGYIFNSEKTEECPVCSEKKSAFVKS